MLQPNWGKKDWLRSIIVLTSAPVLVANRGSGYPSCPRTQPQVFSAGAIAPAPFSYQSAATSKTSAGKRFAARLRCVAASRFRKKLAEEAVISEPVSARWFPVPRENTGKFADFGLEMAKAPRLPEENSIAYQ
jgi:hypothetical protein